MFILGPLIPLFRTSLVTSPLGFKARVAQFKSVGICQANHDYTSNYVDLNSTHRNLSEEN